MEGKRKGAGRLRRALRANRSILLKGMRDGIPIGLGYLAVSFSLGIAAREAGLSPFQGFLASLSNNASAGEYAGFMLIAANSAYFEIALMTLVVNARYFLMGCALSQRLPPNMPIYHRLLLGYDLSDEIFGVTIARRGFVNPYYTYGIVLVAAPCWSVGTAIGIFAGNLLPVRLVSALSVALYGMFLAVIIPPTRKNRVLLLTVAVSFAASFVFSAVPFLAQIQSGTRTIILTVVLSALAALFFPVKEESDK